MSRKSYYNSGKKLFYTLWSYCPFCIVTAVLVASFWYEAIYSLIREILGVEKLKWWQILIIAIIISLVFYAVMTYAFKVPIVDIF